MQEGDDAAGGDDPIRRCILSGERAARHALVRLVLAPDGQVLPDLRAKAPGRGAWIGVPRAALETALAKGKLKGALARAFKTSDFAVPADLPDRIERGLEQAFRDRLGLEAKAGALVIGGERIERAAREGRLALLLHASDAGADGRRRLDQAWRVGSEQEGSDLKGLVLPFARPILSMALGRENVVSLGITDPGAARRLRAALDRWLHFIGSPPVSPACETPSQGASAVAQDAHD
ncbi:MAG: transcription terminating nucleic-acid-binding protein [Proteobacteria bacterium SG_bin5]|nr:MAG: transcription terminating nucleic-acid-binding protein [Proteobacteria bacterium SG_bin5]